ncbi:MAG: hypothetical protein IH595_03390 [Bacteroidales bacterium]|nr:hypothetical protein [Bacteroidales bacterium]
MNEIIQNQKEELKDLIYKAPALITLYAVNHRGESLGPSEERAAIIYLSILCNQGPEELQDFFVDVKKTFQECLSKLDKSLPKGEKERKAEIEEQLLPVKHFINTLPLSYKTIFKEALLGFLTHARGVVGDTLESVILPFISDNLRKIENERMRWIL